MRIAVIYGDKQIFVEFTTEVFVELLKTYLVKYNGSIDQAMEAIVNDLKKQTLYV